MVLGVAAALAAGAGEAGMGIMALGQQAAMGQYLSYSRMQEIVGRRRRRAVPVEGRDHRARARSRSSRSCRTTSSATATARATRPASPAPTRYRATVSRASNSTTRPTRAWNKPGDPGSPETLRAGQGQALRLSRQAGRHAASSYPEYLTAAPARYARAYAYRKEALIDKALVEADALIASEPDNPYFLELKGQVLLESGRPNEAIHRCAARPS